MPCFVSRLGSVRLFILGVFSELPKDGSWIEVTRKFCALIVLGLFLHLVTHIPGPLHGISPPTTWQSQLCHTSYMMGFACGSAGKNPPAMQETWVDPWVGMIPWRRERLRTPVFLPWRIPRTV